MIEGILVALKNTPIWAYILFVFLLYLGLKATKPRTIPLNKLFILPVLFFIMAIEALICHMQLTITSIGLWFSAIMIGALLGWFRVHRQIIKVDRDHKLISFTGSWSLLTIILLIFSIKYYFAYEMARNPEILTDTRFELSMISAYGLISGHLLGSLMFYIHCFITQNHTKLI